MIFESLAACVVCVLLSLHCILIALVEEHGVSKWTRRISEWHKQSEEEMDVRKQTISTLGEARAKRGKGSL
jgi:hypothetical protein